MFWWKGAVESMRYFRIKNWEKFQHYSERNPPWIKLYNNLLDSYEFSQLSDASKGHLVAIWLLASRSKNKLPWDEKWLATKISASSKINLTQLLQFGFIEEIQALPSTESDASNTLANCEQNACLETETEREGEKTLSGKPDEKTQLKQNAREILSFLNTKTGRLYRPVEANLGLIESRLKDGIGFQDLKSLVAKKCREWLPDEKMSAYLRPATLFNKTKCEQYVGELYREEVPHGV